MPGNPFEAIASSFSNTLTTTMAQFQAAGQTFAGTMAGMVQNMSDTIQRGQAAMLGGIESLTSTFVRQAAIPLMPLPGFQETIKGEQGGPGGLWVGQDTGGPKEPLRETEKYRELTDDRRQYYDFQYGGPGYTESPREGEYKKGSPEQKTFFF